MPLSPAETFVRDFVLDMTRSLRTPEAIEPPKFMCPICRSRFATAGAMLQCFNRPPEASEFKVGDLVLVPGDSLWWDDIPRENNPWLGCLVPAVPDSRDHFDHKERCVPWLVITNLTQHEHREVASLMGFMAAGSAGANLGLNYGWCPTTGNTHHHLYGEAELDRMGWKMDLGACKDVPIPKPSDELRRQARILAEKRFVALNLL